MQTDFSLAQLADPDVAASEQILRRCVHCGFCTATCPTFKLLGDELDSPRGRIYLIKDMLENDRPADARTVRHIDRCLSCLSCMTTCPSSVHYMHLVDHARAHIEETFARPLPERWLRRLLALVLPRPALFRAALLGAMAARPFARFLPGRLGAMAAMAPARLPSPSPVDRPQTFPAEGERKMRVALLTGCAQTVLDPAINEATVRLLTRMGAEVVVVEGAGCCGALVHHMGQADAGKRAAAANVRAWMRAAPDRIVVNASGCGTQVKDYGYMLRGDRALAENAAWVSARTRDLVEVLDELGFAERVGDGGIPRLRIAYHSACSMQHGQKITALPMRLLEAAGFEPLSVPEGHICCGSAGTYNLLQPELAGRLRDRKVGNIESTSPDAVAAGNIGCMVQIAGATNLPVLHTAQLLDWATGGPRPEGV